MDDFIIIDHLIQIIRNVREFIFRYYDKFSIQNIPLCYVTKINKMLCTEVK